MQQHVGGRGALARSGSVALSLLVGAAVAHGQVSPDGSEARTPAESARPAVPGGSATPTPAAGAETLEDLVAQLNHEDFEVRERATLVLAEGADARGGVSLRELDAILSDASRPLSLEQRTRLLAIAKRRFIESPRAALGVQLDPGGSSNAVQGVVDGFPASRLLRPGDVIRSIDGVATPNQDRLRAAIVSREPGQDVLIELTRDGQPVSVRVRMGTFSNLGNPFDPEDRTRVGVPRMTLEDAWGVRAAAYPSAPIGGALDAGLGVSVWADAEAEAQQADRNAAQQRRAVSGRRAGAAPPARLSAGGEPRSTGEDLIVWTRGERRLGQMPVRVNVPQTREAQLRQELTELHADRAQIQQWIEWNTRQIADRNLDERTRRQAAETNVAHEAAIRELDGRIKEIQDALAQTRKP